MATPAPDTLQVNKLDELKPANPNETPAVEVTVAYTGTCEGAVEKLPAHVPERVKTGNVKIAKQGEKGDFSCVTI